MSGAPGQLHLDLPRLARRIRAARWILLKFHLAVLVLAVATAYLLPRWYVSSVTLVPAPREAMSLDLTGMAAGLPGASLNLAGPTPQDELKRVVASRAVADSMIETFGLVGRWNLKRREQARERLARHTTLTTPRSGEVIIEVEAEQPERAMEMAAAFARNAGRESVRLKTSLAAQRARYLEDRIRDAEIEVATAAAAVREFEETHGAIALPDQTRGTMDAAGTLQAQVALLETEMAAARHYFTDRSREVILLRERIGELRRQGDRLVRQGSAMRVRGDALPALKQDYVRLTREQASRTAVAELLRRVYEQARVEEANPVPAFSVLDAAALPERHSRPHRATIVVLSLAMAAALSLGGLLWKGETYDMPAPLAAEDASPAQVDERRAA